MINCLIPNFAACIRNPGDGAKPSAWNQPTPLVIIFLVAMTCHAWSVRLNFLGKCVVNHFWLLWFCGWSSFLVKRLGEMCCQRPVSFVTFHISPSWHTWSPPVEPLSQAFCISCYHSKMPCALLGKSTCREMNHSYIGGFTIKLRLRH